MIFSGKWGFDPILTKNMSILGKYPTATRRLFSGFRGPKSLDGPPKIHFWGSVPQNPKKPRGVEVVFWGPVFQKCRVQNRHYALQKKADTPPVEFSAFRDFFHFFTDLPVGSLFYKKSDLIANLWSTPKKWSFLGTPPLK